MIYKILIKGQNGSMVYATTYNEDGNIVDFENSDKNKVQAKYASLLDSYNKNQLDIVADMTEDVTITVDIQERT